MAKRGLFVTFEGMDGCGKTTQMRRLGNRLRGAGHDVLETIEPGGTTIGSQIRGILLDSANKELAATTELLLYFAARAQNVDQLILPALDEGKIVLSDRFTDSSLAYQGCGRGLGAETVLALDRIACRGLKPDLTLLIEIDPATSQARAEHATGTGTAPIAWRNRKQRSTAGSAKRTTGWPTPNRGDFAGSTGTPAWTKWRSGSGTW